MIRLLGLQARRDRRQLFIWVLATGLLVAGAGSAVLAEFPHASDRAGLLSLALATPALLALRGAPNGPSPGSLIFFQLFSWLGVAVALMNTLLAARNGRADEEDGRRELVVATPVSRTAPVVATMLLGVGANLAVTVVAALALIAAGQDPTGSVVAGVALGATGFAFLGVGLLASQLASTSRAANALAGATVGLAYLLRAAGDALGTADLSRLTLRSAWPSWLSPLGWGEQTYALTDNQLWPLLLSLALGAATAAGALAVQSRRDLGHSLLIGRPGPATASPALRSNLGLAWRLHQPALSGWVIGGAVLGFFTGSLSAAVAGSTLDNPQIAQVLASLAPGGEVDVTSLLISAILGIVGVLAAAAGVQGVLRLRGDETGGGAELVLATPLCRARWLADAVAVGTASVVVVLTGVALASGLSFAMIGDGAHAWFAARQSFTGLPAALVFVGLTAGLVSVLPRASAGLSWGLFGVAVVLGLFGQLLNLSPRVRDLSPFSHVPSVPVEHWTTLVVLAAVAVGLTAVATAALTRRDFSP